MVILLSGQSAVKSTGRGFTDNINRRRGRPGVAFRAGSHARRGGYAFGVALMIVADFPRRDHKRKIAEASVAVPFSTDIKWRCGASRIRTRGQG